MAEDGQHYKEYAEDWPRTVNATKSTHFSEEPNFLVPGLNGSGKNAFAAFYWGDFEPVGEGLGYVVEAVADVQVSARE